MHMLNFLDTFSVGVIVFIFFFMRVRFNLQVVFMDETGPNTFVLFDCIVIQFISRTVKYLLDCLCTVDFSCIYIRLLCLFTYRM